MRIIDTNKSSEFGVRCWWLRGNFKFLILIFLCAVLTGCAQRNNAPTASSDTERSRYYYEQAVAKYKNSILQNQDLDRLYFELGKLYYEHGDFTAAIEAFKPSKNPDADKFLAMAYYRAGNFTDALEIFNRQINQDDECLYYYGLTSEKLNLFDQALSKYKKIKSARFFFLALARVNAIEKQTSAGHIKDIDPAVYAKLSAALPAENYPQAGALILDCDEKIEVTAQNTEVSSLHYLVKILNERGKDSFSEVQIEYDSTYEKVELEYARTIKPDGQVVEVGIRHIRDVSKYLNFPLYSNARVFIISFPEIAEGCAIDYKLKIYRSQLVNKKDFALSYSLQASEPIIAANFSVTLPKNTAVHIKKLNENYNNFAARLTPQVGENESSVTYSWKFKDIPQIIPESNMPPIAEINPAILISTFSSWQEVYHWWWKLAKDKIASDTAIKDKVRALTANLNSAEAKIRAIYNFCAKDIRYVAVEYGQAGYEPHQAQDIFKNKYGDCKDQAILLVAMLKESGFKAYPVLISTKDSYNLHPDFPSILFNHCIAAVSLDNKIIFLDPTAETCSFGDLPGSDQGRTVLVFKEDNYQIEDTVLYPSAHNLAKQALNIKINNDETINAKKSVFSYGIYDQAQRFWLLYTPPELIEEALKEKIQGVSIGAKLEKYSAQNVDDLNTPVVLDYSFFGSEYLTDAGVLRVMPQLGGIDTTLVAKDKRKYPVDFEILTSKEDIVEIEIPAGFVVKYMPASISEDNPWMFFIFEYKFKNNKLYFRQKVESKKRVILQDEYPDFKKVFEGLAKKVKQRVILEKVK